MPVSHCRYPAGSLWRRWDLHVHAPGTALNDQFANDWQGYIAKLNNGSVSVVGLTDYHTIRTYEEVLLRKLAGDLPNVELLIPNIEFRLLPNTDDGKAVNLHLLVSPQATDHVARINDSLSRLTMRSRGEVIPCTLEGLGKLGSIHKPELCDKLAAFKEGARQFKTAKGQLSSGSGWSLW
jgi:hypothetical protein